MTRKTCDTETLISEHKIGSRALAWFRCAKDLYRYLRKGNDHLAYAREQP